MNDPGLMEWITTGTLLVSRAVVKIQNSHRRVVRGHAQKIQCSLCGYIVCCNTFFLPLTFGYTVINNHELKLE